MRDRVARWVGIALLAIVVAFLALPLLALLMRTSPAMLLEQLGSPVVRDALWVSIRASFVAQLLILGFGTPAAYVLARGSFRGRDTVIALVELPLVLPPAVAGIALLAAFGRFGLLGEAFYAFGVRIPFTLLAVVLAIVFVAGPLYVRQAIAAFEAIDGRLFDAARTLGAGHWRRFVGVALPVARRGLEAGSALALARGVGEFGATIIFAGNFPGRTQTLSLAVYASLDTNVDAALTIGVLLIAFGVAILLVNHALGGMPSISPSTSKFRFARSR